MHSQCRWSAVITVSLSSLPRQPPLAKKYSKNVALFRETDRKSNILMVAAWCALGTVAACRFLFPRRMVDGWAKHVQRGDTYRSSFTFYKYLTVTVNVCTFLKRTPLTCSSRCRPLSNDKFTFLLFVRSRRNRIRTKVENCRKRARRNAA